MGNSPETDIAQPWPEAEDIVCVILCGGKGSRLFPLTLQLQKSLILVNGAPILWHVVRYWSAFASRFVFVAKHHKEQVIDYVRSLEIQAEFIEPDSLQGIADGIYQVRDLVGQKFIVVLGDCVCAGNFRFRHPVDQAVGVWRTNAPEDIRRSYSVELQDDRLIHVVEKPTHLPNNLCGTGFYFFDRKLFEYIARAKPSPLRNEKEITDVIQSMIEAGEDISAAFLDGSYLNITLPEDIERAATFLPTYHESDE